MMSKDEKPRDDNERMIAGDLADGTDPSADALPDPPSTLRQFKDVLKDALTTIANRASGKELPIKTPWAGVNRHMRGGMWPGLYTLTSSTGSGKTQWALQVALAASLASLEEGQGARPVIYTALELGEVDIASRVLGLVAKIPHWKIAYPTAPDLVEVMGAIGAHRENLSKLPLFLEIAPPLGWSYENILALAEERKPKLMVIDYAQLVGAPRDRKTGRVVNEDVRQTVGNVAKICREAARRWGVVMLALCSTARANYASVEGASKAASGEKLPTLGVGDATRLVGLGKESGELEFTADCALVIAHEKGEEEKRSTLRKSWLAVAKGRGFGPGWVEMRFDGAAFSEPTTGEEAYDRGSREVTDPVAAELFGGEP